MNTNGILRQGNCVGKSVMDLLCVFAVVTIIIPLLTILFDANKTDLNRNLDGILERKMRLAEQRMIPKVNLSRHHPQFDSNSESTEGDANLAGDNVGKGWLKTKSAFIRQRIAERIPGMVNDEEFVLPVPGDTTNPTSLTSNDLEQMAQGSEVNPLALTLPAARSAFMTKDAICDNSEITRKKSVPAFYRFEEISDEEFQLESARDFVESLTKSEISSVTGRAGD